MIGHAELRELDELLNEERAERARQERRSPYLTSPFAMGLAMTRAMAGSFQSMGAFSRKR